MQLTRMILISLLAGLMAGGCVWFGIDAIRLAGASLRRRRAAQALEEPPAGKPDGNGAAPGPSE